MRLRDLDTQDGLQLRWEGRRLLKKAECRMKGECAAHSKLLRSLKEACLGGPPAAAHPHHHHPHATPAAEHRAPPARHNRAVAAIHSRFALRCVEDDWDETHAALLQQEEAQMRCELFPLLRLLRARQGVQGLQAEQGAQRLALAEREAASREALLTVLQEMRDTATEADRQGAGMRAAVEALTSSELAARSAIAEVCQAEAEGIASDRRSGVGMLMRSAFVRIVTDQHERRRGVEAAEEAAACRVAEARRLLGVAHGLYSEESQRRRGHALEHRVERQAILAEMRDGAAVFLQRWLGPQAGAPAAAAAAAALP